MKQTVLHIVGAGVAGLAAARVLGATGRREVVLHEARPQAGGRRRSFYDETLQFDVDTGNFPLNSSWSFRLSAARCGRRTGRMAQEPGVAFADFSTGERWRLRPDPGRAALVAHRSRTARAALDAFGLLDRAASLFRLPGRPLSSLRAEWRAGDRAAVATLSSPRSIVRRKRPFSASLPQRRCSSSCASGIRNRLHHGPRFGARIHRPGAADSTRQRNSALRAPVDRARL